MSAPPDIPARPNAPGFLVALEGIDGAGKSTQGRLLAEWLEAGGRRVTRLREPTDGPVGQEIRRLAREGRLDARREMELFLKDRRRNVDENIRPALERGDVVMLDRYYISSIAYQGSRGIDPEEIRRANEAFAPRPNLVFLFEMPVDEAVQRLSARGKADHFEKREALERVAGVFDALDWPEIVRVDALLEVEELQAMLRQALTARMAASGNED